MTKWIFTVLLTFALFIFFIFHTFRSSPDPDGPFLDVHTNISLDKCDDEWQSEAAKWSRCSLSGCVHLDQCVLHPRRRLSIYVQPLLRVYDKNGKQISCSAGDGPSKEFLEMRKIIRRGAHFEPDPAFACLVLPGIDSISLTKCSPAQVFALLKTAQSLLPYPSNLLIVNFHITDQYLTIPSPFPGIFVSAQHSRHSLRPGHDVTIPYPNNNPDLTSLSTERTINLLIILPNLDEQLRDDILRLFGSEQGVQFVQICPDPDQSTTFCDANSQIQLPQSVGHLISSSNFMLIPADGLSPIPQQFVWLALRHGSIPVLLSDLFLPPFFDSIDWYRFSFLFAPAILPELLRILRSISDDRIGRMRAIGFSQIFKTHFASLELILNSTIASLEGRIVPGRAKTKLEWNMGSMGGGLFIDGPAICENGKGEGQTLILLLEDDQGKGRIGPILEELCRAEEFIVRIDRMIIACRSENCPPSIEETSRPLPFAFGILPISEIDLDLVQFTDPVVHSTGPALIFVDFSRQFPSKWSFSSIISDAFRIWSSQCHSILLFPPPSTAGPHGQFPTFGSTFAIMHKHLISHFASSKVPPICSSSPSSSNAIPAHFAICHISEN